MIQISFIILNFFQSKNIEKIIKSIKYSQIKNYEILIIDNNSEYIYLKNKYNNIKNIHIINNVIPKNKSASRNLGINNSKGDFLMFIDGDDNINPVNLQKIYYYFKYYDIIYFNRILISKEKNYIKKPFNFSSCQFIINKNILIDNNIMFEENIYNYYFEDIYFTIQIYNILKNYRIFYLKNIIYNHNKIFKKVNCDIKYLKNYLLTILNLNLTKDSQFKIINKFKELKYEMENNILQ